MGAQMQRRPAAFTLAELVVSMAIMTILLGSMASALLIATHALPDEESSARNVAEAIELVDQIAADLSLATTVIRSDPHVVRFTVPDRGHGDAGPETVRYAWSGTPGDPLTHRYNASDDIELCEDVHEFSLDYAKTPAELQGAPRVLLVVDNAAAPNDQELAKQALMESWGFSVRMITEAAAGTNWDARIKDSDVVYISETVRSNEILDMPMNPGVGVVTEQHRLYDDLGISEGAHTMYGNDRFWIVDDTHEITGGLGIGDTPIFDFFQKQVYSSGALAGGAHVLSRWPGYEPTTVVLEVGGELYGGGTACGRRVGMPWGDSSFDVNGLRAEGRQVMRRAIVWAAAPVVYSSVQITLQIGSDPASRIRAQAELLNTPRVPRP